MEAFKKLASGVAAAVVMSAGPAMAQEDQEIAVEQPPVLEVSMAACTSDGFKAPAQFVVMTDLAPDRVSDSLTAAYTEVVARHSAAEFSSGAQSFKQDIADTFTPVFVQLGEEAGVFNLLGAGPAGEAEKSDDCAPAAPQP